MFVMKCRLVSYHTVLKNKKLYKTKNNRIIWICTTLILNHRNPERITNLFFANFRSSESKTKYLGHDDSIFFSKMIRM